MTGGGRGSHQGRSGGWWLEARTRVRGVLAPRSRRALVAAAVLVAAAGVATAFVVAGSGRNGLASEGRWRAGLAAASGSVPPSVLAREASRLGSGARSASASGAAAPSAPPGHRLPPAPALSAHNGSGGEPPPAPRHARHSTRGGSPLSAKLGSGELSEADGYRNRPLVPGISSTPSKTEPYYACPHSLCEAIIVPHPHMVDGRWVPANGGPAYEGSGELGAYSPQDLQSAYNIPTTGGEGNTIAVVDAGGYANAESDLAKWRERYGMEKCTSEGSTPAEKCLRIINQAGEEGNYPPSEGWEVEAALDLDMASAACPHCHLMLVEANSSQMSDLGASAKKAAEAGAKEISNSYGAAEQAFNSEELNSDFVHEGVMVTAASGDGGYLGYLYGQSSLWYPAAQTDVVSVGGTELHKASNSRGWSEETWWASGGGCSRSEQKPPWQLDTGCAHRTDNDVSAVASPQTPVSVFVTSKGGEHGEWWLLGGTSASSPLVAGIEAHESAFARTLSGADGFYSDLAPRFDVTTGNNGETRECAFGYLCEAEVGYDGPTGVGSPNGPLTLTSLPPLVSTTPATSVSSTGATLNGAIDPQATETTYHFEYGTSTSYGNSTPTVAAGAPNTRSLVNGALTGLSANTTYHYRLVANHGSETANGEDSVFRTASPTVTAVTPDVGPAKGGNSVTISGTNFAGVSAVKFGSANARSFTVSSESSITATPPAGSGTVDVTVATAAGTSATGSGDRYVYERVPWPLGSLTTPADATANIDLDGVSCLSPEWCMAVGFHNSPEGNYDQPQWPYAQRWNGKEWLLQTSAMPIPGEAGRVLHPQDAAIDKNGDVWITDTQHNRVEEISPAGEVVRTVGSEGTGNDQFKHPWGIAIAASGNVWVVDSGNSRIEELSSEGTYLAQSGSAGSGEGQFKAPQGIAVDAAEHVWVADTGNNRVQEYSPAEKKIIKVVGSVGSGDGQFSGPGSVAIDASGNAWVSDTGNNRVEEFSSSGAFVRTFGYGVKNGSKELQTCTGSESCQAGIGGSEKGQLAAPQGITVDGKGNIWVLNESYYTGVGEFKPEASTVKAVVNFGSYYYAWGVKAAGNALYTIEPKGEPGLNDFEQGVEKWTLPTSEGSAPTYAAKYGADASGAEVTGVSCTSQSACTAVGADNPLQQPETQVPLVERWNGTAWSMQSVPVPSEAKATKLESVACFSATECIAVGSTTNTSGTVVPYAALWKSGTWSIQSMPSVSEGGAFTELVGISCTSATFCMSVGRTKGEPGVIGSGREFAERWNGSSWTITSITSLPGTDKAGLSSVSCTDPSYCIAVGSSLAPHPPVNEVYWGSVIQRWNGTE